MSYQIRQPVEQLRPYIRHLVISSNPMAQTYIVLPDTALVIGFQFSGSLHVISQNTENPLAASGVTGLLDRYRVFKNTEKTGSILIYFTEIGASNFLRIPLHELFGQSLSLEEFFSRQEIQETQEKLEAAQSDTARLNILETFLLCQLLERERDRMIASAIEIIYQSKGTIRIAALAKHLHTSQSPLEKRFRALVGASPKKFAGIVRARHFLQALGANKQDAAEHLSAYYDQAHFIKDFKRFSSVTPEQYLKDVQTKYK